MLGLGDWGWSFVLGSKADVMYPGLTITRIRSIDGDSKCQRVRSVVRTGPRHWKFAGYREEQSIIEDDHQCVGIPKKFREISRRIGHSDHQRTASPESEFCTFALIISLL